MHAQRKTSQVHPVPAVDFRGLTILYGRIAGELLTGVLRQPKLYSTKTNIRHNGPINMAVSIKHGLPNLFLHPRPNYVQ